MRKIMRRLVLGCGSVCLFGLVFASLPAGAQTTAPNEWTWMGGSTTLDSSGKVDVVYGTLGTPATGNTPGERASAATWTDKSGNLWLFSGEAFWGNNNDLWMYNPSSALWTWMGGNNPQVSGLTNGVGGVYGTLGTPSAANTPGGRGGSVTWTDGSGNFWMFGGFGLDSVREAGYLNDLWEFNPSTSQWTWMRGSSTLNCILIGGNCVWGQPGAYGKEGAPAATNIPGGRLNAVSWIDNKGNLWMFGGTAFDASGTLGLLNDLWEFEPATGKWTWVSGNSTISDITEAPGTTGQPGVYGALGIPATANTPGGRASAASWADANGNLWLLGGYGVDSLNASGRLNDLWEFDTSKSEWIWMGGGSAVGDTGGVPGMYGTWMTPAAGNYPGGRQSATTWTDSKGNFWLYGGLGLDSAGVWGDLNDLWEFNSSTNQWAWMGGNSTLTFNSPLGLIGMSDYGQLAVYGTLQTPDFANTPGGLDSALGWTDKSGNLWLYGGHGLDVTGAQGDFNDIWEYQPNAAGLPVTATPSFSTTAGSFSAGQTLAISDATPGATIYDFLSGAAGATQYTGPITISSTETVDAVAVASGYAPSAVATATYTVPATAIPTFSLTPGIYPTAQTVTLADTTPGAAIYYAINGTPTTASDLYSGAITISSSETVEAIAAVSGYANSAVATANYSIVPVSALNEWTTIGQLSPGSRPRGRSQTSSWIDKSGNFWLFGGNAGLGVNPGTVSAGLNDLWRYSPSIGEWDWMGGNIAQYCTPSAANQNPEADLVIEACSLSQPGIYGTRGTPSSENIPGGRFGASTWSDSNGNLWLFGGYGLDGNGTLGILNDLWELNPATAEWTWMGGSSTIGDNCFGFDLGGPVETNCAQPSVYGTLGTPAAGNTPGSREDAITWTDSKGNVWLFGGWGYDVPNQVQYYFDELWKFNPATGQWAWMGGSSTRNGSVCIQNVNQYYPTCGEPGTYGTIVTPSGGNIPGGRAGAMGWTDGSGNLWLFSGSGFDVVGNFGDPNDLWEFNPSTNEWAWMGGSNAVPNPLVCFDYYCSPPAIQGTLGMPAAGNIPGGRDHTSGWTDSKGNFWLYGGGGSEVVNSAIVNASSDLWEFTPSANEWAWMGSAQGPGNQYGASKWTDSSGNFWLLGAQATVLMRYTPSAPAPIPGFAVVDLNDQAFNNVDSFTVSAGTSGTTTVNTVVAGGFDSPVTLSAVGLPGGITASFNPSSITGFGTSQVTFSVGLGVAPGNDTLTVAGTSSGVTQTTTVSLTVASGSTVPASTPTFSVPAGTYASTQTLSISDATNGATIYYTTNGTTPTTSSTVYAGPIALSSTETIEAIATASGYSTSAVASGTYTINLPAPSFTVSGTTVTINPGATTGNTSTVTLTPAGGFTGSVALTASVTSSPTGAQYPPTLSFGSTSPVSITGATAGAATLTITTTAATSSALSHPKRPGVPWYAASGAALTCLLLFGIPARRLSWRTMLGMLMLLAAMTGSVMACGGGGNGGGGGGGGSGTPGTTAGSYTVTVSATSGAITETGTVALTVQ